MHKSILIFASHLHLQLAYLYPPISTSNLIHTTLLHALSSCERDISSQPRYRRLSPESSDLSTKTPPRWAPKRGRLQRIATALGKELQTQRTKHRHAQLSWLSSKKAKSTSENQKNSEFLFDSYVLNSCIHNVEAKMKRSGCLQSFLVIPSTKALSAPALCCIFQQSRKSKKTETFKASLVDFSTIGGASQRVQKCFGIFCLEIKVRWFIVIPRTNCLYARLSHVLILQSESFTWLPKRFQHSPSY